MKVRLINYTKDPEKIVAQSARLCYSALDIEELREKLSDESIIKLIKKIMKLGHYSVLEHATFTFAIEGISRVTSHQLVRHRLVSFSQQSQRYVKIKEKGFPYVVPESIEKNEKLAKIFIDTLKELDGIYRLLLSHNIEAEDARYILPQAVKTKIILTANARELLHIFKLRCCNRAQWEIREVAIKMLQEVKDIAPAIFENAGPPCVLGPCPEGQLSCGKPWSKNKEEGVNG
ncbi:MAG: FAD-dependent thymidylate synthase [Candidatus Caldatribacteriota bacterium]|nr:FAD-dependent thymidylate synthase [Candidatus Caldatribacteriota bacterium]